MNKNTQYNPKSGQRLKVLIFLIISFLFCQSIFSQSITWQKTYHVYPNDFGYKILPAPGNCFYFCGYIDNIISSYTYVLKINQQGDTLWSMRISGGLYTATLSNDSCCVIANLGDSLSVVKINSEGNIIWNKILPVSGICLDIKKIFDNGFILCGNLNLSAIIIRIDSSGNFLWNKIINSNQTIFNSVCEDVGSGIVLTGNIRLQDTGRIYIYKTDYNGDYIWDKSYTLSPSLNIGQKIFKSDNRFYVGGNTDFFVKKTFIIKIDTLGNLLQTKIWIPYGTSQELFNDFAIINSNKIVISKIVDSSSTSYVYAKVNLIDSNFNLIKEQVYYPSYSYAIFSSILPLPNKDILFAGTFDYYTSWSSHRYDMYAVRTDSNLNTAPFPPIGITNNNQNLPEKYLLNQNYPNPFNPTTKITYEVPKTSYIEIVLFDVNGRLLKKLESSIKNFGRYEIEFDGTEYSSGIYFYAMIDDSKLISAKKMILLK